MRPPTDARKKRTPDRTTPTLGSRSSGTGAAPASQQDGAGPSSTEIGMTTARQDLWDNPLGTDGFEFIEYAAPDPAALGRLFETMGFTAVARHRSKNVLLYRQGEVNFVVNAEPASFAQSFARVHGPSICA